MFAREWQAFWLAVGFLTRIPVPVSIDYSQQLMNQCSVYFPLVGLLLGAIYAGLYTLFVWQWAPVIAIILVLLIHLWLTGAFHEDGLADSFDALGGGYTVANRLRIMKDSRIGTFGAAALFGALALKIVLLLHAEQPWLAFLIGPCVARLTPLFFMRFARYVTDPDQSKSKPVADGFSTARLLIAAGFVALVVWWAGVCIWATVAVGATALFWGRTLQKTLGGYTGDTLGASVIFTELLFLLGLAGY